MDFPLLPKLINIITTPQCMCPTLCDPLLVNNLSWYIKLSKRCSFILAFNTKIKRFSVVCGVEYCCFMMPIARHAVTLLGLSVGKVSRKATFFPFRPHMKLNLAKQPKAWCFCPLYSHLRHASSVFLVRIMQSPCTDQYFVTSDPVSPEWRITGKAVRNWQSCCNKGQTFVFDYFSNFLSQPAILSTQHKDFCVSCRPTGGMLLATCMI